MCFSPYLGVGGGGVPRGLGHTTCLCSFQASAAQKWKFSETDFFDTLTIQNDQISYVKHVLDPVCVFFTQFGCGGGGGGVPRGLGHTTCLCSFQASAAQKWKFSETDFFDTLTIQNDQISYVKHVLDPVCVFFTLFGCGGGGGPRGLGHTACLCSFQASAAQKWKFSETDFFDTLTIQNDQISYVKHVLDPVHVFFTQFGCGGGGGGVPRGLGHTTCLCSFQASAAQKCKFSETDFFDTLTIQNDQISYVKHVLDPVCVFFTLFGCGGGGTKGSRAHDLLMQFSGLGNSKMEIFRN